MADGLADVGETTIHATCVARGAARGLLIVGPSGSGKSALALQLMAFGARLVADDRVALRRNTVGELMASAPPGLPAMIEARGLGLLAADLLAKAPVVLVVDLAAAADAHTRLPDEATAQICGCSIPVVASVNVPYFPAAIWHYLDAGRCA